MAVKTSAEPALLGKWIEASDRIVVVTHTHPDGDALGSSSAVRRYLQQKGKQNVAVVREEAPKTIAFIAEGDPLLQGEEALRAIAAADLIICTDFNGLSRAGAYEEALRSSKARKVLIDHHLNPQLEEFDLVFSCCEVSSACEMVYRILKAMPQGADFGGPVGECLMAGMTTDTNNFANSVFPGTLQMASELISEGVDRDAIVAMLYNRYRKNRVLAISHILSEHLSLREDGLAVIVVSKELWHRFGLEGGELEGMVNSEKLLITPLAYIRGRSLGKAFFIIDEAQNLTPHEIKTIITRAGEDTKIVFTGDIFQIDQPYLDQWSNGLTHLGEKMAGQRLFEHVFLRKGERSELSEIASRLL